MSRKERERLVILAGVKAQAVTLVAAADLLGVCYRQAKRIWRRYRSEGDAGLVHRLRGKPGGRRKPDVLRQRVLARCAEPRYADFGPTLLSEHLARAGLAVDHNTLRRWLLAEGKWAVRRRRQKHRQWRERKPCFGAMVQLDGSHHDWLEGRRGPCVLMVMVDDATNRVWARFFEAETTRASYDVLERWVRQHGLPASLYVDRDSIYRCEGTPSVAEQLAGKAAPQTQFERAMERLGVKLILANSPQAKGRVERMNGVLQDRLVKELRLAGINDLEGANRFLETGYLRAFNRQFERPPASPLDVHRAVPRNLDEVLSWEVERVVQRDWTLVCDGQWYQLDRQHEPLSLAGRRVVVRTLRDGRQQILYRGAKLQWRALPGRAARPAPPRASPAMGAVKPPRLEHPWRRFGMGVGRRYWRQQKRKRSSILSAPIRAGGASPLRGGDRRRREPSTRRLVAAARPPARIDGAVTRSVKRKQGTFSSSFDRLCRRWLTNELNELISSVL
ncbi:MAG TPA: ISNCY family transposase [Verrucomicrobiota bacterium]|nr:ISNCY family transposase [Verrucomicrobiota bacterium]HOX61986.1 ISNCY family transposase [Verrucomicrobiota bacterium]HPI64436.1 ISNCY family transposase [Verrucomicrobiota bacterium]